MSKMKLLTVSLALVLGAGAFSACSLFGPRNAEDLIERHIKAIEATESYHMNGEIHITQSIMVNDREIAEALGRDSLDMTADIDFKTDCGKETVHGEIGAVSTMMGETTRSNLEMYTDVKEGTVYTNTKSSEEQVWVRRDIDKGEAITSIVDLRSVEGDPWESFKFSKTDNGYKLSVSMKDLNDADMVDEFNESFGDMGLGEFDFTDSGEMVYEFNKDYLVTEVRMTDIGMEGEVSIGEGLPTLDCEATMDVNVTVSDYNNVDSSKYEIPKRVKKSAVDYEDTGDVSINRTPTNETPDTPNTSAINGETTEGVMLDAAKITGDKFCFTVGADIPAGAYKVYLASGQGTWSIHDKSELKTSDSISCGFGLENEMLNGFSITLDEGDEIYMAGDGFVLEFRPVSETV